MKVKVIFIIKLNLKEIDTFEENHHIYLTIDY